MFRVLDEKIFEINKGEQLCVRWRITGGLDEISNKGSILRKDGIAYASNAK
jgi:hypothetical protein